MKSWCEKASATSSTNRSEITVNRDVDAARHQTHLWTFDMLLRKPGCSACSNTCRASMAVKEFEQVPA